MFKKNNESNKSKDRSSFMKASGDRPRIRPPEIRPRPALGEARPGGRPSRPFQGGAGIQPPKPTDTAGPGRSYHSQPPSRGAQGSRHERFRSSGSRHGHDRPRGAAPGTARRTESDSRKWASSTPGNAPSRIQARSSDKAQSDAVRLVPLGGLEEVGRNCSFLEYKNEIVIIDIGLQFPEEETPGIDYIIPNVAISRKEKAEHPRRSF